LEFTSTTGTKAFRLHSRNRDRFFPSSVGCHASWVKSGVPCSAARHAVSVFLKTHVLPYHPSFSHAAGHGERKRRPVVRDVCRSLQLAVFPPRTWLRTSVCPFRRCTVGYRLQRALSVRFFSFRELTTNTRRHCAWERPKPRPSCGASPGRTCSTPLPGAGGVRKGHQDHLSVPLPAQ